MRALFAGALALSVAACSPQKIALDRMASMLASSASVYENDNDPDFVRLAAPSTLKTIEMMLSQRPDNQQLLLTACSGFTEYSYGFLHVESQLAHDANVARDLRQRAEKMYARAKGYCLHGLELRHRSIHELSLKNSTAAVLKDTTKEDVPFLYWTAASWGAEIATSGNQIAHVQELPPIRALLNRAKTLDEAWSNGAIYEALIAFDGLPPLLGGSPASARADFNKAMELSGGKSIFARVTFASTLADPAEKRALLQQAVDEDPATITSRRLTNLIAQRYAKVLLNGAR